MGSIRRFPIYAYSALAALALPCLAAGPLGAQTIAGSLRNAHGDAIGKESADPVLATCVYHLDFDALRAGENYSEEELKQDLHAANGIGFADDRVHPTDAGNRAAIDPNVRLGGTGSSLRVRFPKHALKTAASGIDARIPLEGTYQNNTFHADELFLSYWVRFSSGFDFGKCGGKLPSLGGDYEGSDGRWKGRIMWRHGGSIQFYPELSGGADNFKSDSDRFWGDPGAHRGSICSDSFTSYLDNRSWHNIELHYKFETPGKADGYFEGWVDGDKGHKVTASDRFGMWRPAASPSSININYLLLSTFLGGSDTADYAMTEDTYAWFDEIKVSRQRIGEYARYATSLRLWDDRRSAGAYARQGGLFPLPAGRSWRVYSALGRALSAGAGTDIASPIWMDVSAKKQFRVRTSSDDRARAAMQR